MSKNGISCNVDVRQALLEKVRRNGLVLSCASEEQRNDKEIVLAAVKNTGCSLEYVSRRLKKDREIVLEAVKDDCYSLLHADPGFSNDKEIVVEAVKQNGELLEHASVDLRSNHEVVLEAVKNNGSSLKYASPVLRNVREIVLKAVIEDGCALRYSGKELQNDRDIVLEAVKRQGLSLKYASELLRSNVDVVIEAVRQNGKSLEYANPQIRNDRDAVLECCCLNRESINYTGLELLKSSKFFQELKVLGGDVEEFYEQYFKKRSQRSNCDRDYVWEEQAVENLLQSNRKADVFRVCGKIDVEAEREENRQYRALLKEIRIKEVQFIRFIGRGIHGSTYLCKIKGELVVVKLYWDLLMGEKKKSELIQRDTVPIPFHVNVVPILEQRIAKDLNITKLPDYEEWWVERYGSAKHTSNIGMVFMRYHRLSLGDYLFVDKFGGRVKELRIKEILSIFSEVLEGIRHLNRNMIIHRDLHVGNVFVDGRNGRVWIGDFGCSLDLRGNSTGFMVPKDKVILFSLTTGGYNIRSEPFVGGFSSLAPELLSTNKMLDYSKSDLFSVGILGKKFEIAHPRDRFERRSRTSFLKLVDKLLKRDPRNRICSDEALSDISRIL